MLALTVITAILLCGCAYISNRSQISAPQQTGNADTAADRQTSPPPTIPPSSSTEPSSEAVREPVVRPQPSDGDFVRVCDHIPSVSAELPYSTPNNFTGQKIYDFTQPWLRYGTAKKLIYVQEELSALGLYIKIWDGFRPVCAQFKLWQVYPDPTFVANPNKGFSSHSRGNTVDITLVDKDGKEVCMPTAFDDFSSLADRDYSDCPEEAAQNARLLEDIMERYGFKPYFREWWHFTDLDSYPVDQIFQPVEAQTYFVDCNEYISLRSAPSTGAKVITTIPARETFLLLALYGDFALIEFQGVQGYVLHAYIQAETATS